MNSAQHLFAFKNVRQLNKTKFEFWVLRYHKSCPYELSKKLKKLTRDLWHFQNSQFCLNLDIQINSKSMKKRNRKKNMVKKKNSAIQNENNKMHFMPRLYLCLPEQSLTRWRSTKKKKKIGCWPWKIWSFLNSEKT